VLKGDNLNRIGAHPHACQGINSPTSTIVLQVEKHHVPTGVGN